MGEQLSLRENYIGSLDGLGAMLGKTGIESLDLQGNPVEFIDHYRKKAFRELPRLQELDGVPVSDDDFEPIPSMGNDDDQEGGEDRLDDDEGGRACSIL